jgi:hypothetical protein
MTVQNLHGPQQTKDDAAEAWHQRFRAWLSGIAHHRHLWLYILMVAALLSLAVLPRSAAADTASIERGEYLASILGCGGCHTEGALEGAPYGDWLAGSKIGIAYTNQGPLRPPAVVFPANLTSHKKMGIGRWSKKQIARAIVSGIDHTGGDLISVMPWMNYSLLKKDDVRDIVNYLKSLPALDYAIPDAIPAGKRSKHDYVRIGVYRFKADPQ